MEMLVHSQEIVKHAIPWPLTCRHLPALCCKTVLQQKSLIALVTHYLWLCLYHPLCWLLTSRFRLHSGSSGYMTHHCLRYSVDLIVVYTIISGHTHTGFVSQLTINNKQSYHRRFSQLHFVHVFCLRKDNLL